MSVNWQMGFMSGARSLNLDEDKRTGIIESGRGRVNEAEYQMIEVLFNESLFIFD